MESLPIHPSPAASLTQGHTHNPTPSGKLVDSFHFTLPALYYMMKQECPEETDTSTGENMQIANLIKTHTANGFENYILTTEPHHNRQFVPS